MTCRNGFTVLEGLVVVAILAVLAALLLPATRMGGRRAASRTQSKNHLKNHGLAAHNWQETHQGAAPPGGTVDAEGRPLHGWTTFLLPFVDEGPLFDRVDLDKPWDDAAQGDVFERSFALAEMPTLDRPDGRYPAIDYAANARVLPVRAVDAWEGEPVGDGPVMGVADGTSQTILFGEIVEGRPPWGRPGNLRDPIAGINVEGSADGFAGPWVGGCQFAFCDGSVRFLSETIDPAVLKALSTPAEGDDPGEDW